MDDLELTDEAFLCVMLLYFKYIWINWWGLSLFSLYSGYLFEGHLTVEPEPPPSSWLVAQNSLTALEAAQQQNTVAESSQGRGENSNTSESSTGVNAPVILQQLINSMQEINGLQDLDSVIEASLQV